VRVFIFAVVNRSLSHAQVDEITDLMTESDVARFLKDKLNVPQSYCKIFEGDSVYVVIMY